MLPSIQSLLFSILIISIVVNVFLITKVITTEDASPFPVDYTDIDFAFSNLRNNPKDLLVQGINDATNSLDIAIYNIKDKDIARAILHAQNRGVSIRILTDATKAENKKQAAILDDFQRSDIVVKVHSKKKMHLKMAIIDERLIITGSYNFTEESATENIEQILTIANVELAEEWTKIFDRLWNQQAFISY